MTFKNLRAACLLWVAGLPSAQAPASSQPVTTCVQSEALFQAQPLSAWSQDGSPAAVTDLQAALTAQTQRTPAEVQEALLDANRGPVAWAQDTAGLGVGFTKQRYPATIALLLALHEDMRAVNRAANAEKGHRPRPALLETRVNSIFAENLNSSASYPSARSASSRVWALLLADVF